ncbi:phage tail assembly chaperone [Bordetella bronchialis]|uniref:Phage tail protein n=1 Tax=Bordetella bronchialis TaxID=463025 RepID=A0A193FWZ6_9BORD|nr:phage tail assembly chaperone [Bordetella bronchialis]ANN66471.1 hypothetical protein BAU06_09335 [Bordetella bronchialis]ANN71549.1 hypothetical protein BAU08_09545 [Bordetella bronchialis]
MTFQVKANPTIDATITIVGQGREQKLTVTFRHKTRSEYTTIIQKVIEASGQDADIAVQILESWDADVPLDVAGLKLLEEHQPGAVRAILEAYGEALSVGRRKN